MPTEIPPYSRCGRQPAATQSGISVQALASLRSSVRQLGSIYERPIRAWPPGYTRGGRYAIVFLSIPWSMHHADGTYLLERDGNGWKVLLRQFVYYV